MCAVDVWWAPGGAESRPVGVRFDSKDTPGHSRIGAFGRLALPACRALPCCGGEQRRGIVFCTSCVLHLLLVLVTYTIRLCSNCTNRLSLDSHAMDAPPLPTSTRAGATPDAPPAASAAAGATSAAPRRPSSPSKAAPAAAAATPPLTPLASGPAISYPLPRELDLANTNILITGGTSGVGLEAAKVGGELRRLGCCVALAACCTSRPLAGPSGRHPALLVWAGSLVSAGASLQHRPWLVRSLTRPTCRWAMPGPYADAVRQKRPPLPAGGRLCQRAAVRLEGGSGNGGRRQSSSCWETACNGGCATAALAPAPAGRCAACRRLCPKRKWTSSSATLPHSSEP